MDAVKSPGALSSSSTGFIDAETFDFNLSVSPESQKSGNVTQEEDVFIGNEVQDNIADEDDDDDDEVYLGPVSFKEQCVATRVELTEKHKQPPLENLLTAEQYVELFKEANAVALQLGDGQEKDGTVDPPELPTPIGVNEDQELNLSVDLLIGVSQDHEREHKHNGEDLCPGLKSEGLSVIERYKRLTQKKTKSPRRNTYVVDKKESKMASVGKASSEGPTRISKLRSGIAMHRTKLEKSCKSTAVEPTKQSQLTGISGTSLPMSRVRQRSSSGSQDGNRNALNTSSSSSSSNSSVSSLPPCATKSNSSQRSRLSKLRPPKAKQDPTVNKRGSLGSQLSAKDNPSEEVQQRKIPSSKPSLLKPSGLAKRPSGLARPKPASATKMGSPPRKRKSQPMKATLTMEKASKPKDVPASTENSKRSSLRPPATPCTPRGQEKSLFPRKRILSSASSCSTSAVSSSCSELDSSIPSIGTPARSRRRSCLPTPSKGSPGSVKRRSGISTPSRNPREAAQQSSSLRRRSSNQTDGSPAAKKPAVLKAVQSYILDHSSQMNASTPELKPIKRTELIVQDEPSTSPAVGTLINFNELPTKSVKNPFSQELFKEDIKENLIEF